MKEAGLIVYNSENSLVIDSKYSNGVLIKSGYITNNNMKITITADLPLLFIRIPNSEQGSGKIVKISDRTFQITLYWGRGGEYYIFDITNPDIAKNTYGLQVFNAEGKVVFNSNAYYCNMIDTYTFPEFDMRKYWAWTGGQGVQEVFYYSVQNSRTGKLAIMNKLAIRHYQDQPEITYLFIPTYSISGLSIKMTCAIFDLVEGAEAGTSTDTESNNILIADVGGLPVPYDVYAGI